MGGGAFNNGHIFLNFSVVKGNKAGQGGGLFAYKPDNGGSSTNFFLTSSTVSDNKAIATELTPVPGPAGTSITGSQSACNTQSETAAPWWSPLIRSLSANDHPERDPQDWMFQGYDGTNWITIHTIAGFSFNATASGQRYQAECLGG